jgi:polygalacturonase
MNIIKALLVIAMAIFGLSQQVESATVRYSVKSYGATGNGVTDDRPGIQAAINAAASNSGWGYSLLPRWNLFGIDT